MAVFAESQVIIMTHGAALGNVLFMSPVSCILLIVTKCIFKVKLPRCAVDVFVQSMSQTLDSIFCQLSPQLARQVPWQSLHEQQC